MMSGPPRTRRGLRVEGRPRGWLEIIEVLGIDTNAAPTRRGGTAAEGDRRIDITPTRPEHVLLVAEVVSPGSETTDRIVKVDQYAKAGTGFYWRIGQAATGVPLVCTYVLDPATKTYRDGDVHTGVVKVTAPFPGEIDLSRV